MSKTLAIRHYVTGVMYHAGNSSVRIMSARELAAHFGIACSTVSLALKELAEEGYIYSKAGIGNFTNPLRMRASVEKESPKLIGFMQGDGRFYYWDRFFWKTFQSICEELFDAGFHVRQIQLQSPPDAEGAAELLDSGLDGLLWIGSHRQTELVRPLLERGVKIVTDSPFFHGVNRVVADASPLIKSIADRAEAARCRNVLFCQPPELSDVAFPLLEKELAERGGRMAAILPERMPFENGTLPKECFTQGERTAVVLDRARCSPEILPELAENPDLVPLEYGRTIHPGEFFLKGKGFARAAAGRLRELFDGDDRVKEAVADYDIFRLGTECPASHKRKGVVS